MCRTVSCADLFLVVHVSPKAKALQVDGLLHVFAFVLEVGHLLLWRGDL